MTDFDQSDLQREAEIIRGLTSQWFADERVRDLERSLSYLAPDVVLQLEGAPQEKGLEAAKEAWEGFFAIPFVDLVDGPRSVTVAQGGDLAFDVGEWAIVTEGESGRVEAQAKSLIVWQKRDDQWKAVGLTFSMNTPAE